MKNNQITEETIKQLVDRFYGKVAQDEDLGPDLQKCYRGWGRSMEAASEHDV
jgi:truncated hemoglobin YjbI